MRDIEIRDETPLLAFPARSGPATGSARHKRLRSCRKAACRDASWQTRHGRAGCQSWVRITWAKFGGQPVDRGDDLVALRHGERSAGAEIVLDIDDQKDVPVVAVSLLASQPRDDLAGDDLDLIRSVPVRNEDQLLDADGELRAQLRRRIRRPCRRSPLPWSSRSTPRSPTPGRATPSSAPRPLRATARHRSAIGWR